MGTAIERVGLVNVQSLLLLTGCLGLLVLALSTNVAGLMASFLIIGFLGATFVPNQVWTSLLFAPSVVGLANATAGGWGNCGGGIAQLMVFVF